jgi:ubiquinone/menaquinone biosynthesis C-methylase UbiE
MIKTNTSHNKQTSRVTRGKSEAKSTYDRISRAYDLITGKKEKKTAEIGLKLLNIQREEKILEIGFGTGNALLEIARSVSESGRAYGLDISIGMLEVTRKKLYKYHLLQRVELITGDAVRLPYDDKMFDSIFMSFTLELFDTPEIPVVLNECKRVLSDDGRICVVSMSRNGRGLALYLYEWAHRIFPKYIDCRPIFLANALEDAGFQLLKSMIIKMWRLPVEIALAKK